MTNKEFFNAYRGKPVLYKGKDIGAYVAGYIEDKYIILGLIIQAAFCTSHLRCIKRLVKHITHTDSQS